MTAASAFLHQQSPEGQKGEARLQEPSMEDILASIRRIIADDQVQGQRTSYGGQRRGGTAPEPVSAGPGAEARAGATETRGPTGLRGGYDDVLDLARMRGSAVPERGAAQPERGQPAERGQVVERGQAVAERDVQTQPVARAMPEPRPTPQVYVPEPPGRDREATEDYDDGIDVQSIGDRDTYEPAPARPGGTFEARLEAAPVEHRRTDSEARVAGAAAVGDALISAKPGASVMSAFETLAATVILQNDDMLERIMRDQLRPLIKTWLDENLPTMVERLVRSEIERVARGGRS